MEKVHTHIVVSAPFHIQSLCETLNMKHLHKITTDSLVLPHRLVFTLFDSPTCISSVAERPQHMLMRVSVGIHKEDIDAAIEVCVRPLFH